MSETNDFLRTVDGLEILENLPLAVSTASAVRGEDGEIVDFVINYLNPTAAALAHIDPDARALVVGKRLLELVPVQEATALLDQHREVVESGRPLEEGRFEFEGTVLGEHIAGVFELRVVKFGDGYISLSREVTEELKVQEELAATRAEVEQRRFRERQSAAINDNIINSLVQASNALDRGDTAAAKRAVAETLSHASRIVLELRNLPHRQR